MRGLPPTGKRRSLTSFGMATVTRGVQVISEKRPVATRPIAHVPHPENRTLPKQRDAAPVRLPDHRNQYLMKYRRGIQVISEKKIVCATCSMPVPFRVTSRQRHTASTGFQFRPSTIHNSSDFGAMICAGMLGITGTAWLEIRPRGVKRSRIGAVPELRKFGNSPV
jgi:hypothetical protein